MARSVIPPAVPDDDAFAAAHAAERPVARAGQVPTGPGPDLPPLLPALPEHLHGLHQSPAPAFPAHGTAIRSRLKRAANRVLGLVGLPQRRFNEALVETLTLMMAEVRGMRGWLEHRATLLPNAPDIAASVDALRAEVRHLRDHVAAIADALEHQRNTLDEVARATLETAVTERRALAQRIDHLYGAQDDVASWITTLQRKYEALSLEARALVEDRTTLPEPRVIDPDAYGRCVADMPDGLRVNLGCGEHPWPGYVNVDLRPLPGVLVLADVRRLPFNPGSLAEIASAHLVEHFREHLLATRILPYWRTLLRPDGRVRIVCPDWEAMLARVRDGRMALPDFKVVTFGLQDYVGDDHFAMYTPDTLAAVLSAAGFAHVEVVARDRLNGICPEMELVARP